jgi:hypothetical protein
MRAIGYTKNGLAIEAVSDAEHGYIIGLTADGKFSAATTLRLGGPAVRAAYHNSEAVPEGRERLDAFLSRDFKRPELFTIAPGVEAALKNPYDDGEVRIISQKILELWPPTFEQLMAQEGLVPPH